ncbi:carboxylesterase [Paraphaeosphaeria sporulosa]|uniref:Carboxylic ester hydrolase n=1 Tax=Paraphaeosphaeria sporulosa TaxID=1460663 RepID=A0A177CKB6_9PLEO|nr:carboxylesterase [Paraphaeosphaeria sporulosa]OAG07965.1 carboxylesterase [Paraphaeosphaeria sporulosa]
MASYAKAAAYLALVTHLITIKEYRGIRFAEPPIGASRWKAPQPYNPEFPTDIVVDATKSGPPCVQGYPQWTISGPVQAAGSEDCLMLDVYTPGTATKKSHLPVALSIPGGGYVMGYAGQSSPYALMRHSNNAFIFVNIQYRLGAYGFLGSARYTEDGGATNAGLLDQRLALEWVQEHIEAFGGDPSKVTILGGSAGGGSVTSQLTWKGGNHTPPFRAAMADFPWWQQFLREEQLTKQYDNLLEAANCATLMCLKALPEDILKEATQATYISAYADKVYGYGNFYYGPYVDGDIIRDLPSRELRAGKFVKVPTWVSREGYEGFTFSNQSMTTTEEEVKDLHTQFPYANETFVDDVFGLYPRDQFNSTFWQRSTWFGDFSINCPTYYVASSLASSKVPVYKQIFNVGTQLHGATGPYLADLNYASEPGANVMSVNFTELGAVDDTFYDDTQRCNFFWEKEETVQN